MWLWREASSNGDDGGRWYRRWRWLTLLECAEFSELRYKLELVMMIRISWSWLCGKMFGLGGGWRCGTWRCSEDGFRVVFFYGCGSKVWRLLEVRWQGRGAWDLGGCVARDGGTVEMQGSGFNIMLMHGATPNLTGEVSWWWQSWMKTLIGKA